jgi:hypothetical protein
VKGLAAHVVVATLALGVAGCHRTTAAPVPAESAAETTAAPGANASADPTRLVEDPVAGKHSEAQWRQHMADEERERQLGFDLRHLKEHRAIVQRLIAARARLERAKTEAAVPRARAGVSTQVDEVRKRVAELDHWGVNSRLLEDYAAMESSLSGEYAEAAVAAAKGEGRPLEEARKHFDEHLKTVHDWLEAARDSEENEKGEQREASETSETSETDAKK